MHPYDHSSSAHISEDVEAVKSLLIDEWIKKWCIYTMECNSAIKRNKIVPSAAWIELATVKESEVSQKEKTQ